MRESKLYLVIGLLVIALLYFQASPAMAQESPFANHVVINEVESDPMGDDSKSLSQWVELYNPTSGPVNIGGWTIGATTGLRNTYTISAGATIQSGQFLTYTYGPSWFPHNGAIVQLKDKNGTVIDQTVPLSDQLNDFTTWQRIADGYYTNSTTDWVFKTGTPGSSNGKISSTGSASSVTITVATDKTDYIFGDIVKISGQVSKQVNISGLSYIPELITIRVTGFAGFQKIITVYPDSHLQFKTELKTDPLLGMVEGSYNIVVTYSDATALAQFTLANQAAVAPTPETQTALSIFTDKPSYVLGDPITILGNVSKVIPLTPVTYKVYDPTGASIYDGTLYPDSQGKITSNNPFLSGSSSGVVVDTVNPVYGTYNIIAKYDSAQSITSFVLVPAPTLQAPIVVTTDKQAYGLGETAIISGGVKFVGSGSFEIEILQSYTVGNVKQTFDLKTQLNISPDGTFRYQFPITESADRLGTYRVIVTENAAKAEADFNVVENPSTFVGATSGPLSITTEKPSYALGDSLIISGNVAPNQVQSGISLLISVFKGDGTVVLSKANVNPNLSGAGGVGDAPLVFYAFPDGNGNYNLKQTLSGSIFAPGTYTLKASYAKLKTSTSFSVYDPRATGNQAIVASTDKQVYGIGETVHLTGKVSSSVDTSSNTITLTLPDGSLITNPLPITNGLFSWDWTIPNSSSSSGTLATIINSDRKSVVTINNYPNTFGIYKISINSNIGRSDFFFGVSKNPQNETKLSPFFLQTDKTDYSTTQTVRIVGQVIPQSNAAALEQNAMPSIVVFTKTGQEVFRSSVSLNAGGQFQTSIDLRPGIYKTGEYKIYGSYLGSGTQTSFKVTDPFTTTSDKLSLLLTTDHDKYLPGDTVLITGRTSYIISINSVEITVGAADDTIVSEGQVVSKKGNVLPKATVDFDQTSSFSYDYKIPQDAKLGSYTIVALVPFGTFNVPFQVVDKLPEQVVETPQANGTNRNNTQVTPPVPQNVTSSAPKTIGPTHGLVSGIAIVDKVNRLTDSFIPIAIKEKTLANGTLYPRVIDGLLRVNPGDESTVNLKVTLEDGTCIIGPGSDCKITGSTENSNSLYQTIQVGGKNYLVGYTGTDVRLEKFSILPAEENGIIQDGQWYVEILNQDKSSRFYYQISYISK